LILAKELGKIRELPVGAPTVFLVANFADLRTAIWIAAGQFQPGVADEILGADFSAQRKEAAIQVGRLDLEERDDFLSTAFDFAFAGLKRGEVVARDGIRSLQSPQELGRIQGVRAKRFLNQV
jgi:hypothetical protein